jgi:phosphohistidine phosphatase SixA
MADCAATTILIRHADVPANGGANPHLSEVGLARAEALAALLRNAGVGAIIGTDIHRSRETARSVPLPAGAAPVFVELDTADIPASVAAVLAKLDELPAGTTALVIGHTPTLPRIIAGLGGPSDLVIPEGDFDHLFVQTGGCVTHLRYPG